MKRYYSYLTIDRQGRQWEYYTRKASNIAEAVEIATKRAETQGETLICVTSTAI